MALTHSRHLVMMKYETATMSPMPMSIAISRNVQTSFAALPGNSMYSIPDCSRGPGDDSHMNAAKHGCESF